LRKQDGRRAAHAHARAGNERHLPLESRPHPIGSSSLLVESWQDAQKGPYARRRPKAAGEAYFLYVEPAVEGANEADGPFSASCALDALEVAEEFPVGDGLVECLLLEPAVVQVVLDDLRPERRARRRGPIEFVEGLAQRLRHLGEPRVLVRITLVEGRRLELLRQSVKPRGDGSGEGEIGIGLGTRDAVLHAEARALPAEAKATRAVVPAARDAGRREAARLIPLVGIDRRRVEIREVTRHRHLPGQPVPEQRRPRARAVR